MGKVHRIKRSFYKALTHNPWEGVTPGSVKGIWLAGRVCIGAGVRYDGSKYIGHYGESYTHLAKKLIREYEAGVAHGDKGPVTG